ncbi:MAG: topoisomerase C-terminal repeat-containing protein [Clostridia bacterium]|nr:topoisomerase C-terminal repeat-containing protein [Clostridia bacterium]
MTVIIAEKPSLARNIVAGITDNGGGAMAKRNGYFEGGDYIVTWAFGHLFSLCDIEDYTGGDSSAKWTLDNLPCFPTEFRYKLKAGPDKKVDAGVERQFETIKHLCLRNDVDRIVNAGDSDREGEIIIRLCVMNTGALINSDKKFLRLWLPDQTPETVGKALAEMKDEEEYQNLADEGFARTYIDWLYGVNLTRYATLKSGTLLRVGRVIVPIVRAIYDRDMAIRNFVPDVYYTAVSKEKTRDEEIELVSKEKFDKDKIAQAEQLCAKYNASRAVVVSKKSKKETVNPGKLFSLSKLQSLLGKKYKMSMADSLAIVQKLYEEGYLTYPRTNSEYLATNEKDKIKKIISNVKNAGYPVVFKDKKTIFDDSKIESHSALTPTYKIPKKEHLSEKEMQVYQTVFRRFVSVFCEEECIAQKTEMVIDVGGYEQFTLKGITILQRGFLRFDDSERKDKILPPLEKGDEVTIQFKPVEKQTSPPRHYTIETLNNYLKNPFREDKAALAEKERSAEASEVMGEEPENDEEDYKAIFEGLELGTEATRTGIIDNARKSGYIELKKDVYTILPGGEYLIEQLMQMNISMDKYKTSVLGQALKKVYRGTISVNDSVKQACDEISAVFERKEASIELDTDTGFYGDLVGKCPVCGKDVLRDRYGYGCSGYKEGCKFKFNSLICKRAISISNARALLSEGKTAEIQGFVSKNGRLFNSRLKLEGDKVVFDREQTVVEFNDEMGHLGEIVGACPLCGKNVIRGKQDYGCIGYRDGCRFRIGSIICGKQIPIAEARRLLATGRTGELHGFLSKSGKQFSGRLKVDGDRVVFDF